MNREKLLFVKFDSFVAARSRT